VYPRERWLSIEGERVIPVDIALESEDRIIFIEIESRREDPSNNVAKIPYWLEHSSTIKKVIMIQLFSAHYEGHRIKREVAEYLGNIMMEKYAENFVYQAISMKMSPKDFDVVYDKPVENEATIISMAQKNAERIVEWLTDNHNLNT
jgi:hypothetical protein